MATTTATLGPSPAAEKAQIKKAQVQVQTQIRSHAIPAASPVLRRYPTYPLSSSQLVVPPTPIAEEGEEDHEGEEELDIINSLLEGDDDGSEDGKDEHDGGDDGGDEEEDMDGADELDIINSLVEENVNDEIGPAEPRRLPTINEGEEAPVRADRGRGGAGGDAS